MRSGALPSIPNLVPIGRGHIYKKRYSRPTLHRSSGACCSSPLTSVIATVPIERRDNICRIHGRASDAAQRRGLCCSWEEVRPGEICQGCRSPVRGKLSPRGRGTARGAPDHDRLARHRRGPLLHLWRTDSAPVPTTAFPADPVSLLRGHAHRYDRLLGRSHPGPRGPIGDTAARDLCWALCLELVHALPWYASPHRVGSAARRLVADLRGPHRFHAYLTV